MILAALAALLVSAGGGLFCIALANMASIEGWLSSATLAGLIPLFLVFAVAGPGGRRHRRTVRQAETRRGTG